jgi:hypothetical protein
MSLHSKGLQFAHIQMDAVADFISLMTRSNDIDWHLKCKYRSSQGLYYDGIIMPYYTHTLDCFQAKLFLF